MIQLLSVKKLVPTYEITSLPEDSVCNVTSSFMVDASRPQSYRISQHAMLWLFNEDSLEK
jgi:hypothetical protein